jgi:hypothetical protein
MIVALKIPYNMSIRVNLATLGEVLALNSTLVKVTCATILPSPFSTAEVYAECSVTTLTGVPVNEYIHQRKLLSPAIWPIASATLASSLVPGILYITARTSMQPVLPISSCSGGSCTPSRAYRGLRVVSLAPTGMQSVTLSISTTASSSALRSERKMMSCVAASTSVGGGCVSSSCDLEIGGPASSTVTVTDASFEASDITTGTCVSTGISIQSHELYGDIATTTNETVVNTEHDYRWFLFGSIIVFVVGWLLSTVLFVVLWKLHKYRQHSFATRDQPVQSDDSGGRKVTLPDLTPAEQLKTSLLGQLAHERSNPLRLDRASITFGAFSILCAVAASSLTIFYVTASDRDSNFTVMYEEYSDSLCSASPTSSMPRRIFSLPHSSSQCTKMAVTGETAGVVYADGKCEGSGGSYNAVFQSGGTFLNCMSAPVITVPSKSCVHISAVNPYDSRDIFVQLFCSTRHQIADRTTTLADLTTSADVFVTAPVSALNEKLAFASREGGPPSSASDSRMVYEFPYLTSGNVKTSTSMSPMTFASTAASEHFDGQHDASRVVLQKSPVSFKDDATASLASYEAAVLPHMARLDTTMPEEDGGASKMRPSDGDYGVGYMFGGFGTTSELTWQGAGPQSHRHYDIRGTSLDVAHHLPTNTDEIEEGSGFSISLYLRASNNTKGFAFAITDAFENTLSGAVYTLDRLAEMIENGQPSSAWFAHTYRVYASLYVSGPAHQITFAHADPSEVDRVQLLDWDLERIGANHLFNGLWHHVAIVNRVENGKLRATLMIDGSTSYSQEGWSVCADRLPPTMGSTFSNGTAPIFDQSTDKVTDGGLLVVGYLNGGVYGLTVSPVEKLNTDYLEAGTSAMRQHNAFPRTKTLALGATLMVLGVVALLFLIVRGIIDVKQIQKASHLSGGHRIMREFLTLQHSVFKATTVFDSPIDDAHPVITLIRLSTALRWTGLKADEFGLLPAELISQTKRPDEQLLLLLFNAKMEEERTRITVGEWNALVKSDAEERAASRRCFCIRHRSDADEDSDILGTTTNDMFTRMNAKSGTVYKKKTAPDEGSDDEANDVEHRGDVGRLGDVDINFGKRSSGGGSGMADGVLKTLADVLAPVIVVFQSMYVWSTSIHFPSLYDDYFGELFSFVSIDVAMTFPGIPSVVTPLAQMALGFIVVAVVIYFIFEDHRRFESSLVQYVWRRDALEMPDSIALHESLPDTLTSVLRDTTTSEAPLIVLKTLPVPACRELDLMTGRIPDVEADSTGISKRNYAALDRINVSTVDGVEYSIARSTDDRSMLYVETPSVESQRRSSIAASDDSSPSPLHRAGCHCWRHPNIPLTGRVQTDIFPFNFPSSCSCVVNGQLCGAQVGLIYSCGKVYTNDDGEKLVCTFGLCEAHCRLSIKELIVSHIYGAKRVLLTNGLLWGITVLVIFMTNTIYTPFLKTALMIFACHPQYQCEFEHCWNFITQDFALAAFLSGCIVLVLGIGFPVLLLVQLYRRRAVLNIAFFGEEYHDRYVSPDTRGPGYSAANLVFKRKSLSTSEWSRFGSADISALARYYANASYRWLMMPALVLVFKVLVLIPAVFLEPRSFELRLGSGVVEIAIAIFYFSTNTQLSPILLMTIRAASTHQLLILGLQNMNLVLENDSSSLSLSYLLIGVTLVYVAFSLVVVFATSVYPIFASQWVFISTQKFLNLHGFDYSSGISLYLEPTPLIRDVSAAATTAPTPTEIGTDEQHDGSQQQPQLLPTGKRRASTFGQATEPSQTTFAPTVVPIDIGCSSDEDLSSQPLSDDIVALQNVEDGNDDDSVFNNSLREVEGGSLHHFAQNSPST